MIKELVIKNSITIIKDYYPQYNETKLKEIKYGLEGLYLTISKLILIFIIALYLGIFKEVLLLTVLFNIVRFPAFGVHASKSSICFILSAFALLGIPMLIKYVILTNFYKIIICFFCIVSFGLYAPADTKKRPIINYKKRKILKFFSLLIAIIFSIICFFINNTYIVNTIIAALLIETILILPITYRLLNQDYNNYKCYIDGSNR